MAPLVERARREFERTFGRGATPRVAVAPGRINLIGEHTDYNDGFVLPMAIDRHLAVAFAPRSDRTLRVRAAELDQVHELSLETIEQRGDAASGHYWASGAWSRYVAGVAWAFADAGYALGGADLAIVSDLPIGGGLSSSAALEIAVARALSAVSDAGWDGRVAATLAQRAEHVFAGVLCGIMDQLSVACAREQCALLIDCRSLDTEDVPVPGRARLIVIDTGVRRELAASGYNDRRAACARVVAAAQRVQPDVRALRDVDEALLAGLGDSLDPIDARRAAHVIAENRRPHAMSAALATGDLARAGRLMLESHASLRDLYEVSCPELDRVVELACGQDGCQGARLTGAGFGGCAIALVDAGTVDGVMASLRTGYQRPDGRPPTVFECRPSGGARIVENAS
jgi:galactokinase